MSCTFSFLPDFVAKTQNPSVPDPQFDEFMVPSLDDFDFFFFFMNGNTERAQCALSRVCIP